MLTEMSMDWFEECYRGDEGDWRYCPMLKSQAGMPPTLVTTASLDPIRDQGRAYAAACVASGVPTIYIEAQGTVHGFVNLRRAIPSTANDIARSVAALKFLLGDRT
jgi:acetyl esterase